MNDEKKTMHLRYNLNTAYDCGESRHAQKVMKSLGITYTHSTPQSLGDQWWFWNCENVPESMPDYLTLLGFEPLECIGHGISEEDANAIRLKIPPESRQEQIRRIINGALEKAEKEEYSGVAIALVSDERSHLWHHFSNLYTAIQHTEYLLKLLKDEAIKRESEWNPNE